MSPWIRHKANVALWYAGQLVIPLITLAILLPIALVERWRTWRRRRRGELPRLVWGPTPILNLKYVNMGMRERGYDSATYVLFGQIIAKHEDFDLYRDECELPQLVPERARDYYIFSRLLRDRDAFIYDFSLGAMRAHALQWLEYPLMRLAGKKLIACAYGSDTAVSGHIPHEDRLYADYPTLPAMSDEIERKIEHTTRWANVSVRTLQPGYEPAHNVILMSHIAIDSSLWADPPQHSDADGHDGEVTIIHAPNHRHVKGTVHLESAVRELQEEGLKVRLEVLEKRPNEEIRKAMRECDIAGDQFLWGYALFAIEGMSSGKPVMSNLDTIPPVFDGTEQRRECPIFDTTPETVREDLRKLVENPALRRELGERGRAYVERYHSERAMAETWDAVIRYAWTGADLPEGLRPPVYPGQSPKRGKYAKVRSGEVWPWSRESRSGPASTGPKAPAAPRSSRG